MPCQGLPWSVLPAFFRKQLPCCATVLETVHCLELASVQALLETLSRALLRRRLEALAGYDTSETGKILAGG